MGPRLRGDDNGETGDDNGESEDDSEGADIAAELMHDGAARPRTACGRAPIVWRAQFAAAATAKHINSEAHNKPSKEERPMRIARGLYLGVAVIGAAGFLAGAPAQLSAQG